MKFLTSLLLFIARLCIATLFVSAGVNKFISYEGTYQYMAAHGFTMIPLFLIGSALLEILAGIALIIGYRTRIAATLLILFLLPATIIFHSFWLVEPAERHMAMLFFFNNLAVIGGLLYMVCSGAGGWSFDRKRCCCQSKSCPVPPTEPPTDKKI